MKRLAVIFVGMSWRKAFNIFKWIAGIIISLMLVISALLLVFKDDIKAYALEEANKYLNKRVHIGYIDIGIWKTFPDLTLSFDDVLVHSKFDTLQTKDTAVFARKINLRFNPLDFFESNYDVHRIDINDAQLNLKILENGAVNYDFLKPSEDSTVTPFEFNLEEINLQSTDFTYENESTQQLYAGFFENLTLQGSFNEKQFVLDAKTKFDVKTVQSKAFTLLKNRKATCDIKIQMDQINNVFEIQSADLSINELPFLVKGKVSEDSLDFYIGAKNLDLAEVATNFSLQELDVVDEINGQGKVNFELFIKGANEKTKAPAIDANFDVSNGQLSDQGFALSHINLKGNYSNGIAGGKERLSLSTVQFHTLNENFKGDILISDFDRPRMKGKANGTVDLKAIHRLFGPFSLKELSGNIALDGRFDLRMNQPKIDHKNFTIYDLRASLSLQNIAAQFYNDQRKLKIKNGEITIRNQQAGITDLALSLDQSSLVLDGQFNHLADYFKGEGNLYVDAQVNSQMLNIDDLSKTNQEKAKTKTWLLPNNIDGKLILSLANVYYSGHQYTDIQSHMNFGRHQLIFPLIEGISATSTIKGKLKITEERPMYLLVETTLQSDAVNFKPLFKEWNNFDQTVITSDNIQGQAAIHLNFKGPFDLYAEKILKEEFDVKSRVRITNGALINVLPFKKITESLKSSGARLLLSKSKIEAFENRLLNLKFDSFENNFNIKNGVITIPKMTIHSNALNINLSGTHSFENDIDYSFDFRFRELKGNQQSEFGDVVDDETGLRIFLKMYGTIDNPIFSWDKSAKKEVKEKQREEAKEDLKSALKTGFGINKKDSTVKELKSEEKQEEKVIMDFDKDTLDDDFSPVEKKKKKGALQRKIDQWKKENNEEEKEEPLFEVD